MNFKLLKLGKYLFLIFAALVPTVAILGALISPPKWAETSLDKYGYSFRIFVGFSDHNSGSGEHEYRRQIRSYILLPSMKTVTVTRNAHSVLDKETNFQEKTEVKSEVTTKESTLLTYYALLSYIGFLFGSWWYWIRPTSRHKNSNAST